MEFEELRKEHRFVIRSYVKQALVYGGQTDIVPKKLRDIVRHDVCFLKEELPIYSFEVKNLELLK